MLSKLLVEYGKFVYTLFHMIFMLVVLLETLVFYKGVKRKWEQEKKK